jgi:hypothetical protein
VVES